MDKVKAAEKFLQSLEDPTVCMDLMLDRIETSILYVIHNYAELVCKIQDRTNLQEKDMITCAMVIGYLLKSHVDRVDLERIIKEPTA